MYSYEMFHRTISHGPYAGMVETITNKNCKFAVRCCWCSYPSERGNTYYSVVTDSHGALHSLDFLCASCAREHINGIQDRAGKSPYQSLDPRKELRLLQARKNRARARRHQTVTHLLFWLVIAFACVAVAAFIVCASYTITKIVLG